MESIQERRTGQSREKNGDKERGADLEMRIKSCRDFILQSKIKFLPLSFACMKFGQNYCVHRVQCPQKHRFTWLLCKNMTKNNSQNLDFRIHVLRNCSERAV